MKKYKFTAAVLLGMAVIYVICNDVAGRAGMFLAKHCIQSFGFIGMPVYGFVHDLEKNEENAAVRFSDGIYPINGYARGRYIPDESVPGPPGIADGTGGDGLKSTEESSPSNDLNNEPGITDAGGDNDNTGAPSKTGEPEIGPQLSEVVSNNIVTGTVYPRTDLNSYNFLMSNFYTVTSITELGSDKLRPDEFLQKDLRIARDASKPQILIFHTHSQEAFADSVEGDVSTTIVGVGEYLSQILREKYGYNVIHDTSVYDYVDGRLDRSKAYTYAENAVARILQENPSVEVVIDLHRDGVPDTTRLVSDVNGKETAKIMFFNGLSYSRVNGDISYLPNPNRDDNLAMSLQMQLLGNAYYPGFLRRIYVNAYRYCLHMRGRSMLVEAGAQNNTIQEVMNAMEPLADILDKELRGEKCW